MKKHNYFLLCFYVAFLLGIQNISAQSVSKYIVVDQFGYLPDETKIAVIRDPVTGYDASESFSPSPLYALVNASGQQVFTAAPQIWSAGATDASSGDKAWWFDFSSVKTPGEYYVLDIAKNVRSHRFQISETIFNDVLKHAVRTFFYQRAGFGKTAQYAGAGWADAASHTQDSKARAYNDKNNAAKEKNVSGGWYDAGDFNKYSNWTAGYITMMMLAYLERPQVWTDNYNIPESNNGIPDLLDEAKWGIEHLLRMQQKDGSVIAVAALAGASPPSSATGTTYYGGINTISATSSAGAFAIASGVYRSLGQISFADTLVKRAKLAWDWSTANPNVLWRNNESQNGSQGIGAGQQETDDYGRTAGRVRAAIFLYGATGETKYRDYVDANYQKVHLIEWGYVYPYEGDYQDAMLYYTTLSGATASTKNAILNAYKGSINGSDDNLVAHTNKVDPYRAHLKDYTWGSNNIKAMLGNMFHNVISYNIDPTKTTAAKEAALGYVHYLHGTNPLNLVYLTNMNTYGAENSANELYHTWFTDKSAKWDRVGTSTYGPAPGFLTGGPNTSYDWDGCCANNSCGSTQNNAICTSLSITPPKGQPKQKSYLDFNTQWPLNSWSVTENSNGYQLAYIRMLSKFVSAPSLPTGVEEVQQEEALSFELYPNPTTGAFWVSTSFAASQVTVLDISGAVVKTVAMEKGQKEINLTELPSGSYFVKVSFGDQVLVKPLIKM
jgi:endoglucanase